MMDLKIGDWAVNIENGLRTNIQKNNSSEMDKRYDYSKGEQIRIVNFQIIRNGIFTNIKIQDQHQTVQALSKKIIHKSIIKPINQTQQNVQLQFFGPVYSQVILRVIRILTQNGWKKVGEESKTSKLQWVYQINAKSLTNNNQMVNHFKQSHLLTTKIGLNRTLTSQHQTFLNEQGRNHITFYPRTYDIDQQYLQFEDDFKRTAIFNLFKKIMISFEIEHNSYFQKHRPTPDIKYQSDKNWDKQLESLIKQNKLFYKTLEDQQKSSKANSKILVTLLFYLVNQLSLDGYHSLSEEDKNLLVDYSLYDPPYDNFNTHFSSDSYLIGFPTEQTVILLINLYQQCLLRYNYFNNDGLRNIWVVKTSESSRGRSIYLVESLQEARIYRNGMRVIQKYMENVWIYSSEDKGIEQKYQFLRKIKNKKFDIRLWVLVKSFNPLAVYIYDEGYLRLSQSNYQLENIEHQKTHLTNYSINWKHQRNQISKDNSYILLSEFYQYLDQEKIKSSQTIKSQINQIITFTLQSADLYIASNNQNCFELFGFDIILDSKLKPWLLQCNMSPACQERGQLKSIVCSMGTGLLSIIGLIHNKQAEKKWIRLIKQQSNRKIELTKAKASTDYSNSPTLIDQFSQASISKFILPALEASKSFMTTTNNFSANTAIKLDEMLIRGKKIRIKKYLKFENYLSKYQKGQIIQKYWKSKVKRRNQNEIQNYSFLKLVSLICLIVKSEKKKGFDHLKRYKKSNVAELKMKSFSIKKP